MNKRERMSEERFAEIVFHNEHFLPGAEWPVVYELIGEVRALKAEVREKDEQLEALGQLQIGQMEELRKCEAEVTRLRGALEECLTMCRYSPHENPNPDHDARLKRVSDALRAGKDGE